MKRLIALSLSLCMVGTMLAACSSSQDTAQEDGPVTITIWHDKEDEVAAALQAELMSRRVYRIFRIRPIVDVADTFAAKRCRRVQVGD